MKYIILVCSLSQFIVAAENIHTIQRLPILSAEQAILLEKKLWKHLLKTFPLKVQGASYNI
jgi:hypothetical protein